MFDINSDTWARSKTQSRSFLHLKWPGGILKDLKGQTNQKTCQSQSFPGSLCDLRGREIHVDEELGTCWPGTSFSGQQGTLFRAFGHGSKPKPRARQQEPNGRCFRPRSSSRIGVCPKTGYASSKLTLRYGKWTIYGRFT
jgi:hypothetical protein